MNPNAYSSYHFQQPLYPQVVRNPQDQMTRNDRPAQNAGLPSGCKRAPPSTGGKSRFQMNLCLVCNAAFLAEKVDSTNGGVLSFLNLCNVLQVPTFQEFVPESNPLCPNCSGRVDEYIKLQNQIKELMDRLGEMRRLLGERLVETYGGTPISMKNYEVKGKIYKVWYQKLHGKASGQGQEPSLLGATSKVTSARPEENLQAREVPPRESGGVQEKENPDYTMLDISNSVSSSGASVSNFENASATGSIADNNENENSNQSMGCPSPSPPSPPAFEDDGPTSDQETDVYIKNLNDEEPQANDGILTNESNRILETANQTNNVMPIGNEATRTEQTTTGPSSRKPIMEQNWIDKRRFRPIVATASHRRTHPCKYCGKLFPAVFSLQMHERTHTGERPFNCSICNRAFAAKAAMQKHELTHDKSRYEGEPQYECDLCGKRYHLERSLYTHKRDHMGIKRLRRRRYPKNPDCPSSKKKYPKNPNCPSSKKRYPKKKKPKDPNAPTKPRKEGQPKRVSRKKTREVKLDADGNPIPEEPKPTRRKRSPKPPSNRPKRTFTFPRRKPGTPKEKVPCPHCGKLFPEMYTLNLHIMVHTGEKPLQCPFPDCPKSFRIKGNLDKHMKTHDKTRFEGEPTHMCDICGKGFYILGTLYHHRRRVHLGLERKYRKNKQKMQQPCTCKICGKQFQTVYGLSHHKPIHGEPKFNCEVCGKPFHRQPDATDHAKRHEPTWMYKTYFRIKCSACPPEKLPFQSKLAIRQHWAAEHKNEKLPDVYKKPPKPKKPPGYYVCTFCPEGSQPRYNQAASLSKHKRAFHSNGKTTKIQWKPRGSAGTKRQKKSEDEMSSSGSSSEDDDIDFEKECDKGMKTETVPVRRSSRPTRGDTSKISKLLMEESDNESGEDVSDIFPKIPPSKTKNKVAITTVRKKSVPKNAQTSALKSSVKRNTEPVSKLTPEYINKILGGQVVSIVLERIDKGSSDVPSDFVGTKNTSTQKAKPHNTSSTANLKRKSSVSTSQCSYASKPQNLARRRGKPPGKRHIPETCDSFNDPSVPVLESVSELSQDTIMSCDVDQPVAPDLLDSAAVEAPITVVKNELDNDEVDSDSDSSETVIPTLNTVAAKRPNFSSLVIHNPLSKNKVTKPIIISALPSTTDTNSQTAETTNQVLKSENTDENETVLGF